MTNFSIGCMKGTMAACVVLFLAFLVSGVYWQNSLLLWGAFTVQMVFFLALFLKRELESKHGSE